jgi:AcrR family transcriptional regulator
LATSDITKTKSADSGKPAGKRLDEKAWIVAALKQLSTHGIDGVRIELLARDLGVTKGSFYWHFKDRDELRTAMLEYWRSRATLLLIERMNQSGVSPIDRLEQLIALVAHAKSRWGDDIELALRLWARRDGRAQATLAEVDALRVRYIACLLADSGFTEPAATARALMIYAFMRVAPSLGDTADPTSMELARQQLLSKT